MVGDGRLKDGLRDDDLVHDVVLTGLPREVVERELGVDGRAVGHGASG